MEHPAEEVVKQIESEFLERRKAEVYWCDDCHALVIAGRGHECPAVTLVP